MCRILLALMLRVSIIDNLTLSPSWVSDFTCRCALIFGGEMPLGGCRGLPVIGWSSMSLVPIASDSGHPRLRLQLLNGVPPTNENIIVSIVFAIACVSDRTC